MKAKQFILIFLLLMSSTRTISQTVLLDVDHQHEKLDDKGPNTKKYSHGYLTFGFIIPPEESGSKVEYGSSFNLSLGARKKYKVSGFYSMGWEIMYNLTSFNLKQENGKTFPDSILYSEQSFSVSEFGLSYFNRFNFNPRRGNIIGKYLDLGITGKWAFSMSEMFMQDVARGRATVTTDKLNYNKPWQAAAFARAGSGHWALWASYRITDLFKRNNSYHYNELPRYSLGLEIGFF